MPVNTISDFFGNDVEDLLFRHYVFILVFYSGNRALLFVVDFVAIPFLYIFDDFVAKFFFIGRPVAWLVTDAAGVRQLRLFLS